MVLSLRVSFNYKTIAKMKNVFLFIGSIIIACCLFLTPACKKDKPNPCADIVCLNGGECGGGVCVCPDGFTGVNCQTTVVVDLCANVFCNNNGTCVNGTCNCATGWTGANCQTPIVTTNPCDGVACYNGGVCVNGTCDCPPGYTGTNCQTATTKTAVSVTVYNIPASNWDSFSAPDIFIGFGRSSNTQTWDIYTNVAQNQATTPFTLQFTTPLVLQNENYDVAMSDYDGDDAVPNDDDVIISAYGFNPYTTMKDNKINVNYNGQVIFSINLQ